MCNAVADRKGRPLRQRGQLPLGKADVIPCLFHQTVPQLGGVLQQRAVDIKDKAGRHAGRAIHIAPLVVRKVQRLFRARHGDKGEPPLLLHRRHGFGPGRGEHALAQATQEHIGKFQALGGVHGHQLDRIAALCGVAV